MFLSMIIFDIICFGVYYDYMFIIVDLPLYSSMESYTTPCTTFPDTKVLGKHVYPWPIRCRQIYRL
jgi:hypothetical protein